LVVVTLGACSALQGFENVGVVNFRRELQFDKEFRYLLTKKLAGFIITVPLAFWLRNYWALVFGILATRAVVLVYSYIAHPFRPRLSLKAAPDLMHFSKWLMTLNLLGFLRERSADFIVGRLASSSALGTFSVAAQIASMPSTELVAPINRAILPAYVKLAHDKAALGEQYLSVMSMISLVAVPAVAGVAATAPFVVLLVLGPTWRAAIPALEILAFFGITQVLQTNAYSAFLALGKPQVFAKINTVHVVVLLSCLLLLVPRYGMIGAAWAYLLESVIVLPVNFGMITYFLGVRPFAFVTSVWRPLIAAAVMYAGVRWLRPADAETLTSSVQAIAPLAKGVAVGVVIYLVTVLGLWVGSGKPGGAETWLINEVRTIYGKVRRLLGSGPAPGGG
jgi:lipopolysaccharide exporter